RNAIMESVTILDNVESKHIEEVETVTIRFAGDSGDGMQLTGTQFTNTTAVVGNDILNLPDLSTQNPTPPRPLPRRFRFPAEFFESRHSNTWRRAECTGCDESCGSQSEPSGSRTGRNPDNQYRRF